MSRFKTKPRVATVKDYAKMFERVDEVPFFSTFIKSRRTGRKGHMYIAYDGRFVRLYAKYYGSEFPCADYRVRLTDSVDEIIVKLENL